ncbi:MAG TPA: rhomboid family intramembrane serine protease [Candidatus Acidoferrales bacterium]
MDSGPTPDAPLPVDSASTAVPAVAAKDASPPAVPWPQPRYSEFMQYPVVSATAALAVAVTLAWWAKVDISTLFASPQIGRGQWWRLLTSVLPHINLFHLIFNLSWLWVLGTKIEKIFGHLNTVLLFLILGLGSNAFQYALDEPGVGLSGIGYGLFGLLWVLSARDPRFAGAMDKSTVNLFVGWFFLCVVLTATHVWNVGNIAHGAGAIFGILIGFAIAIPRLRPSLTLVVVLLSAFSVWGSAWGRPKINFSSNAGWEEAHFAYLAMQDGNYADAVRWSLDSLRYRPNDAPTWYNLGVAYENLGQSDQAYSAYDKAAKLDPNNTDYEKARDDIRK